MVLSICSLYGASLNIRPIAKKSNIMLIRCKEDKSWNPARSSTLIIILDLMDNGNLSWKCCLCSNLTADINVWMFTEYCMLLYTSHLWCSYKKSSMQIQNTLTIIPQGDYSVREDFCVIALCSSSMNAPSTDKETNKPDVCVSLNWGEAGVGVNLIILTMNNWWRLWFYMIVGYFFFSF